MAIIVRLTDTPTPDEWSAFLAAMQQGDIPAAVDAVRGRAELVLSSDDPTTAPADPTTAPADTTTAPDADSTTTTDVTAPAADTTPAAAPVPTTYDPIAAIAAVQGNPGA